MKLLVLSVTTTTLFVFFKSSKRCLKLKECLGSFASTVSIEAGKWLFSCYTGRAPAHHAIADSKLSSKIRKLIND